MSDTLSDSVSSAFSVTSDTSNPDIYPDDPIELSRRSLSHIRTHDVFSGFKMATNCDQNYSAAMMKLVDGLHEGVVNRMLLVLNLDLIPEEILKISIHSSLYDFITRYTNSNRQYFGVCYKINEGNNRTFGTIGIICKYDINSVRVMGYRRFEIVEVYDRSNIHDIAYAKIKIIKDITLTNPYNNLHLHTNIRALGCGKMFRNRDMWQTQWPAWVYKQFDAHELASCISKKVKVLRENVIISDDPSILSFQLTRLGIFSDEEVNNLLSITSTNLRLQCELHYLNKIKIVKKYLCAGLGCGVLVFNMSNVFAMYPAQPQDSYQNCRWKNSAHGMITVTDLVDGSNILKFERVSFECHCFPGYKSTSIFCLYCNSHLGWRFVMDDNVSLTPMVFYGLSETALKIDISSSAGKLVLKKNITSRDGIDSTRASRLLVVRNRY